MILNEKINSVMQEFTIGFRPLSGLMILNYLQITDAMLEKFGTFPSPVGANDSKQAIGYFICDCSIGFRPLSGLMILNKMKNWHIEERSVMFPSPVGANDSKPDVACSDRFIIVCSVSVPCRG